MKKIISIVLLCTMLLACFAGCGAKQGQIDLNSFEGEIAAENLHALDAASILGEGNPGILDDLRTNVNKAKTNSFEASEVDVLEGEADDSWYTSRVDNVATITTAEQLIDFRAKMAGGNKFAGVTIKLGKNINLNGATLDAISAEFNGTFDGQNYVIYNFDLDFKTATDSGFFGSVKNATVQNFALVNVECLVAEDVAVSGIGSVGGIINQASTAQNVYSNATFSVESSEEAERIGGLFGRATTGSDKNFINCEFAGTIDLSGREVRDQYVGGLLGYWNKGSLKMSRCLNTGAINAPNANAVGGLLGGDKDSVGGAEYGLCKNEGNIVGNKYVGGLVGSVSVYNASNGCQLFTSCTNTGAVTGNIYVGGFMGRCKLYYEAGITSGNKSSGYDPTEDNKVILTGCTNSGNVTANGCAGGLLGTVHAVEVKIDACTFSGNMNVTLRSAEEGVNLVGGLIGSLFQADVDTNGVVPTATLKDSSVTGTLTVDEYVMGCEAEIYVGKIGIAEEKVTTSGLTNTATVNEKLHPTMVGYQESATYTEDEKTLYDLRFVAVIKNSAAVNAAGFKVTVNYKGTEGEENKLTDKVAYAKVLYTSIKGTGSEGVETYTATEFGGDLLVALVIEGIPADYTFAANALEVIITPFTAENAETFDEGLAATYGKVVVEPAA